MTSYSKAIDNSKTNVEGLMKDLGRLFTAGVPLNYSASSLQVVQRGAGANMSVDVSIGDAFLLRPTTDYGFWVWQDAATNASITTANATNPRIDAVVAWVDISVTNTTLNNSPGSLKFSVIAGTPAGSPSAPVDATIQSALGASVAWTRLANVTVGAGVTSIVNANISDQRVAISARTAAFINDASVTTLKISDAAVTPAKLVSGAGSSWSGQSWTPTLTNVTLGNGTVTAKYTQIGKIVDFRINILFGSTTSVSGLIGFSLPVTAATYAGTANIATRDVQFLDFSAGTRTYGLCLFGSTTRFDVFVESVGGTYTGIASTASGTPYAWGVSDEVQVSGRYEAV